jgi:hypothetical protein
MGFLDKLFGRKKDAGHTHDDGHDHSHDGHDHSHDVPEPASLPTEPPPATPVVGTGGEPATPPPAADA